MGLFLQTAIIKNCVLSQAEKYINKLSGKGNKDEANPYDLILSECKLYEQHGDVFVHFNDCCSGYEELAQSLSIESENAVLLLYIYDSDFWGYELYDNGKQIDSFNPVPEYFSDEVTDSEIQKYAGKSAMLIKYFNVNEDDVKNYLVRWGEDFNFEQKAYVDDTYGYEEWQMVDFIRKLGYIYNDNI